MVTQALTAACLLTLSFGADDDGRRRYAPHRLLARSASAEVNESSGVAPSHFDPEVFWTHNDKGRARVYAFRLSAEDRERGAAAHLGYVELRGYQPRDWEDLAAGPDNTLYAFDGGDNPPCDRSDKRIIRFREPKVDWNIHPRRLSAPVEYVRVEYPAPDGDDRPALNSSQRYDAECLLVHPQTGDLYVVTKRDHESRPTARLYRLPAASLRWSNPAVHILQFICDLSPAVGGRTVASMITGGSISPDARRAVLRNYLEAYEFTLPPDKPFEEVFRQKPRSISLLGEPQGEAICYSKRGDLITTSEAGPRGRGFPVYVIPAATQPSRGTAGRP